ncbi:MAG: hypothetical protein JWN77_2391 [Frankiales bacterium]|nr:hypothetical protein [Frankiales bacterium]
MPIRLLLAGLLLTGCSGSSCDELAGLTQERDAARARYAELVAQQVTGERLDEAHDVMHGLDQQVYDLDQDC